jgi:hypothetical protein
VSDKGFLMQALVKEETPVGLTGHGTIKMNGWENRLIMECNMTLEAQ